MYIRKQYNDNENFIDDIIMVLAELAINQLIGIFIKSFPLLEETNDSQKNNKRLIF